MGVTCEFGLMSLTCGMAGDVLPWLPAKYPTEQVRLLPWTAVLLMRRSRVRIPKAVPLGPQIRRHLTWGFAFLDDAGPSVVVTESPASPHVGTALGRGRWDQGGPHRIGLGVSAIALMRCQIYWPFRSVNPRGASWPRQGPSGSTMPVPRGAGPGRGGVIRGTSLRDRSRGRCPARCGRGHRGPSR